MRFAVSNIAWPPESRDSAYLLLRDTGFTGLEIAPGLFFHGAEDPFAPSRAEADAALGSLREAGLELVSMQSLLFGVSGAALFGDAEERARLDRGMLRAIDLAGQFGIPNLVFGSPRQRVIPEGMDRARANEIAIGTFSRLGDAAQAAGSRIALEPNPAAYGTNFLTHASEALAFVEEVDHPAITLNLDVGAFLMNDEFEAMEEVVNAAAGRFSHVHISEPHLAPAPASSETAREVLRIVEATGFGGWYSIEMKAAPNAPLAALNDALLHLSDAAGRK